MERGLFWLPLLVAFFWLAWQGSQEFKKLQAYQIWAEQFERTKYDIYAVLAQKGNDITWGKPTTKGPIELETFSLLDVQEIRFLVNDHVVDIENPPQKGRKIELDFLLTTPKSIRVPFTEVPLAAEWGKFLQRTLQNLQIGTAYNRSQESGVRSQE
ncbi:hypothetical protein IQ226_23905 [Dolichospermum sp. LEGE 00240]|jgi:hypothetical protein|uniref:hypothetical protein n=1 Tax=Dolichospermum sp. LEGE 00240 TaxID=1828603 RepID=UPI00187E1301|nr:hypothetical protein [Dolichospermum sp. LEGE 00240]MDM3844701.1 hypothetical protein [Aphanizomenon gracile PMC638.10]MDM3851287.1 hypothetical protein [Aphanizomenon gracile PMC627.10]MDM3855255.1 hypothetical protein [Aphanizomenon gracile PMC649.10]MDM3862285.1 hypothetical protein [Aphanizomenon gracile PMC644.10]MBE9252082.1 hypothetical protein [Dolichospermum sp. LEGE 00240]